MVATEREVSLSYLENLWFLMHRSYDPARATFALTSYLDDSGSDDLSLVTAMGGPIMSRDAFLDFSSLWSKMLRPYRVDQPLHMTDFIGNGRYVLMPSEMKLALFTKVTKLIMDHRLYSLSVAVPQVDFRSLLSADVCRQLIGPYAMAFFCVVMQTHDIAARSAFYAEPVSYLIDTGFAFQNQLTQAHRAIVESYRKKREDCFVGAMAFDSDDRVPALQAADMIAWAARKRAIDGDLPPQFIPINELFKDFHSEIRLDSTAISMMATPINNWLSMGVMPSLSDMIR